MYGGRLEIRCKTCSSNKVRLRYRSDPNIRKRACVSTKRSYAKKSEYFKEQKRKPCMDCGLCFPSCCMDFDHRDPSTKNHHVGHLIMRKTELMAAEIEKCDLVCAVCHRIRTHNRKHPDQQIVNPHSVRPARPASSPSEQSLVAVRHRRKSSLQDLLALLDSHTYPDCTS